MSFFATRLLLLFLFIIIIILFCVFKNFPFFFFCHYLYCTRFLCLFLPFCYIFLVLLVLYVI
jgi:hypothetical protein